MMKNSENIEIFLNEFKLIIAENAYSSWWNILNQAACRAAEKLSFNLDPEDEFFSFYDLLVERSPGESAGMKLVRAVFVDYKMCREHLYQVINRGLCESFTFQAYDYHASMAVALGEKRTQSLVHLMREFPLNFIRETEINDDWSNICTIFNSETNTYVLSIFNMVKQLKLLLDDLAQTTYDNALEKDKVEPYLTLVNRSMLEGNLTKVLKLIEPLYNSRYASEAYIAIDEMIKEEQNLVFFNDYFYSISNHKEEVGGLAKLARTNPTKFIECMNLDTSGTHWNIIQEALSSRNGYLPSILDMLREEKTAQEKSVSTIANAPQGFFSTKMNNDSDGVSKPEFLNNKSI